MITVLERVLWPGLTVDEACGTNGAWPFTERSKDAPCFKFVEVCFTGSLGGLTSVDD